METIEGDAGITTAPLVLGPMLRYVSTTSATVWVETSRPGVVEVLGHRATTFAVRGRHYALVIVEGLEPDSVHPYEAPNGRRGTHELAGGDAARRRSDLRR